MVKRLDELPEELISNISARLYADDICALRLANRALEHKSFHEFAAEYFQEKCFMITTESLKVLVSIANSEKLKGYLHQVDLITALFSDRAFSCLNGCKCAWQPSAKQKDAYRTYVEDQKMLYETGRDKEMLLEAFSGLTALKTVTILDSPHILQPDTDYRGRNKVPRVTGRPPTLAPESTKDKEYDSFVHHVWKILMEALAESKMTTLETLAAQLSRGAYGLSISPDLALAARPGMKTTFSNLQKLVLRISTDSRFKTASETDKKKEKSQGALTMKKVAKALPALRALDLTFDSRPSSGLFFASLALNLDLSKLTKLDLQSLYVDVSSLSLTLCKLNSIKDLRLVFVNLTKGNWITILKVIQTLTGHLAHLHLMYLLEAQRKVYFLKQIEAEDVHDSYLDDDGFPFSDESIDDEYGSDDDDDTDDEMPSLEPVESSSIAAVNTSNATSDSFSDANADASEGVAFDDSDPTASQALPPFTTPGQTNTTAQTDVNGATAPTDEHQTSQDLHPNHSSDDHRSPHNLEMGERGYYVCLRDDQIAAQLPTFIEEYNLGYDIEDEFADPFPGGPGSFNNFMNMLGAAIGVPPPAGAAGPGPAGNAGQQGGANGANGGNGGQAGGGPNGMLGGFTTGAGNGVVVGMGPVPPFLGGAGPMSGPGPQPFGPPPPPHLAHGAGHAAPAPPPIHPNLVDALLGGNSDEWDTDDMD